MARVNATATWHSATPPAATAGFTRATGGIQDTDVNTTGKTIGFDMLYFAATSPSSVAVNYTLDTKGGSCTARSPSMPRLA